MPEPIAIINPLSLWRDSQKFRYLAIGLWNTLAGYAIFAGLYLIIGPQIGYMFTALISHVLAVIQSFLTQRHLVFRSQGNCWAEYLRFNLAHLGSLLIGLVLLTILVELIGFTPLIAQAQSTLLIVVMSYFVHQHFTFRTLPNKSMHDADKNQPE